MTIPEIADAIKALKKESAHIRENDSDSAETIDQLIKKLDKQFSQPVFGNHQSLAQQLHAEIKILETQHPRLTGLINDLLVKLAAIGI